MAGSFRTLIGCWRVRPRELDKNLTACVMLCVQYCESTLWLTFLQLVFLLLGPVAGGSHSAPLC